VGRDQEKVEVAVQAAVLERVVEQQDLARCPGEQEARRGNAIGADRDRGRGVVAPMSHGSSPACAASASSRRPSDTKRARRRPRGDSRG